MREPQRDPWTTAAGSPGEVCLHPQMHGVQTPPPLAAWPVGSTGCVWGPEDSQSPRRGWRQCTAPSCSGQLRVSVATELGARNLAPPREAWGEASYSAELRFNHFIIIPSLSASSEAYCLPYNPHRISAPGPCPSAPVDLFTRETDLAEALLALEVPSTQRLLGDGLWVLEPVTAFVGQAGPLQAEWTASGRREGGLGALRGC